MSSRAGLLGKFSFAGTWLILFTIAGATGGLVVAARDMMVFVSGGVMQIADAERTFGGMLSVAIGVIVLEVMCTLGILSLIKATIGSIDGSYIENHSRNLGEGNHFFKLFIMVVLEELFARYLFLGLLPKISILSGPVAFYALLLIGNGIWALAHLYNLYEGDRNPLRVLPQFVGGIFLSYVFVKFGLLSTLLAHFGMNAVLFSSLKKQGFGTANVLTLVYDMMVAAIALTCMKKPLADTLVWFSDNPQFALTGWGFWDYFSLWAFIASLASMAMNLMQYDLMPPSIGNSEKDRNRSLGEWVLIYLIAALIAPLITYAIYWIAGLFTANVAHRIIIAAIIMSFMHKSHSGSSIARNFWLGICQGYMSLCIFFAIGFWAFVPYLLLQTILGLPDELIRSACQENDELSAEAV